MKRDLKNNIVFGVCSGIAKQTHIDPTILRLLFVIAAIIGFGSPILIYLILAICMQPE